jgi:phosphoglycolate phosphatase
MTSRPHPLDGRSLVIFDKDGTLIDFHAMWSSWVEDLAGRLEAATGRGVAKQLYASLGYDLAGRRALPGSHLAVTPMARLRTLCAKVLREGGLSDGQAERVLAGAWFVPDAAATAHPLTDLGELFDGLRRHGLKIAIATSDDRAPTQATLFALGIASRVDRIYCADDGRPVKPAPEAVLAACAELNVDAAKAAVVGDSVADLLMARSAGALAIGVASGVSPASVLQPHADLVLESVAQLCYLPEAT